MINLMINEWIKLFSRSGTIMMVQIFILLIFGLAGISVYDEIKYPPQVNHQWKAELKLQISHDQARLQEFSQKNATFHSDLERKIAINEYKISHNIAPETKLHVWEFVRLSGEMIRLIGIYIIIVAAGIVSSEYTWGTIKLLAIRPIKRSKILLSKYITLFLFGILLMITLFILSTLLGIGLFGFPESEVHHLAFVKGNVVERNIVVQLVVEYILNFIDLFIIATLAFMISVVFRNSSLAIGISMVLLFIGKPATMLLATKFTWSKFLPFANTDLHVYFDGIPPITGMTLPFSLSMLFIYLVIFLSVSFIVFSKQEIY